MVLSDKDFLTRYLADSSQCMSTFATDPTYQAVLLRFTDIIGQALRGGNKLLVAGNGGSAADAQHIAGEFLSRLFFDHAPLAAIALTTDTSVLTAVGNDYGYEKVFERQVLGLGSRGDVFLGISTSGKSPNILGALEAAKSKGIITLGFAGSDGGRMETLCDAILKAPSSRTSLIQQIHITAAHVVCGMVERRIFGESAKA